MNCYACDREATQRCPRCGNIYCPRHGTNFCGACLDPMHSAPSRGIFRVAILGLFGGAVLALWLIFIPPSTGSEETVLNRATATPALTPAGGGEGDTPAPTPATTPPAAPTGTPARTKTPAPTPARLEHVVVDGDTWYGVAEQYGVDATELASLNHRTLEEYLHPGEVLTIPQ